MHAKVVQELIGKTRQYTDSKGRPYWVTYNKDGTVAARSANGTASSGVWRRFGERVCEKYSNPNWVPRSCHPL
jgi:hypothetical protein